MEFDNCNLPATLPLLSSVTLTNCFEIKFFKCKYLENGESQRKNANRNICRFQYFPSNGIIVNVILSYLYLFSSRSNISNVNISITVRSSAKLQSVTFVDVNICHRMASLRIYILFDLDIIACKIKYYNHSSTIALVNTSNVDNSGSLL